MTRAYVGLGANLGDREATIRRAVELLAAEPGLRVVRVSTLRETEPVGFEAQPLFLNGALALEADVGARKLLERLLAVERKLGRRRDGPRWGPRAIDLDLLLYGDEVIDEPDLVVPHPELVRRRFVLEPLLELAPELTLPDGRSLAAILAGLE